jgi:hypothetical protein
VLVSRLQRGARMAEKIIAEISAVLRVFFTAMKI